MRSRGYPPVVKFLLWGAIFGGVLYYGFGYIGSASHPSATAAQAGVPVSVARVVSQPVTLWNEFSGIFEAVQSVEIRPRVSGQITAIHFKDGQDVAKGTPLFTLDTRPYEAELIRAKGALATAQSALNNAKADYARAAQLIKSRAISRSEFDARLSAYKQAQGALETAQGTVKSAQVNLAYTHIAAPISGKIGRAEITVGNQVEAGASSPILATIVTLSPIYASFTIDEQTYLNTISGISAAQLNNIPVQVGLSNTNTTPIAAHIQSFDNQLAASSGTIRVRAQVDNTDKTLLPGLYARVRIGTAAPVMAILIHPSAVGTDQSKKFVMVVDEQSKAQYREVTLGSLSDGLQVVTAGLKPEEKIIVNGLQRVRPDSLIAGTDVDMTSLNPIVSPEPPQVKDSDEKPSNTGQEIPPADDTKKTP